MPGKAGADDEHVEMLARLLVQHPLSVPALMTSSLHLRKPNRFSSTRKVVSLEARGDLAMKCAIFLGTAAALLLAGRASAQMGPAPGQTTGVPGASDPYARPSRWVRMTI